MNCPNTDIKIGVCTFICTHNVFLSWVISEHSEYVVPEALWPEKIWCSGATKGLRKESFIDVTRWQQEDMSSDPWRENPEQRGCSWLLLQYPFPLSLFLISPGFPEGNPWLDSLIWYMPKPLSCSDWSKGGHFSHKHLSCFKSGKGRFKICCW